MGACSGEHTHLPWGVARNKGRWDFATEAEAEYPDLLCGQVAHRIALARSGHRGSTPTAATKTEVDPSATQRRTLQTSAGSQPRRGESAQLIPEFKQLLVLQISSPEEQSFVRAWKGRLEAPHTLGSTALPKDTRTVDCHGHEKGECGAIWSVRVGLPWSEGEFARLAAEVKHPFGKVADLPAEVANAIGNILENGPSAAAKKRK